MNLVTITLIFFFSILSIIRTIGSFLSTLHTRVNFHSDWHRGDVDAAICVENLLNSRTLNSI